MLVEALDAPQQTVCVIVTEVSKTNWGIGGVSAKDLERSSCKVMRNFAFMVGP